MKSLVMTVVVIAVCSGCSHYAGYTLELSNVVEQPDASAVFGELAVHDDKVSCSTTAFDITWAFDYSRVGMTYENTWPSSTRILWDECVFVGPDGNSHHVIPSEVLYRDYYESVKPSKVPSDCKVTVALIPRDNIRFTGSGWNELPFLPYSTNGSKKIFMNRIES